MPGMGPSPLGTASHTAHRRVVATSDNRTTGPHVLEGSGQSAALGSATAEEAAMREQSEQIRALRRDLLRLRRRAARLRAIAANKRRQGRLNSWAGRAVRKSDAARRALAADRRIRSEQARLEARAGGQPDLDERQRLADLRELEADERERLADLREQRVKERERLADERDHLANQRDLEADRRDLMADKRDAAADLRDQAAFYYYIRSFWLERKLIQPLPPAVTAEEASSAMRMPVPGNGSHDAPASDGSDSRAGSGTSLGEVVPLRAEHRPRVGSPGVG